MITQAFTSNPQKCAVSAPAVAFAEPLFPRGRRGEPEVWFLPAPETRHVAPRPKRSHEPALRSSQTGRSPCEPQSQTNLRLKFVPIQPLALLETVTSL